MYITFDLFTVLVVSGALAIGALVYRRSAPSSESATALSKGERVVLACGAAAAVISIGAYLGTGVRGVDHTGTVGRSESWKPSSPGDGR
ncbi:hypothetical protein [Kitasatospora purpeofusca]|uniref:hypothetical protein n=1 Tax=Kitasatospora purpeofusca TaxID=67352 RepID=UPI003865E8B3|nr:hypothetical protein OIP63_22680 [Kitasatospora purpeofusca]